MASEILSGNNGEASRAVNNTPGIETADSFANHNLYLDLHNSAMSGLNRLHLSGEAQLAVRTAILTACAVEGEERGILWRAAMLRSGITPEMVSRIGAIEEELFRANETGFNGEAEPPEKV